MAEDEYFKQLWADAFTVYEKETERKLTNDQTIRALKSVDDLLQHIEHQGGSFAGWRNKHSKLWSRLSACLTPATVFGGIATDSLTLTPVAAGAPLLGAVLYLITACQGVTDAYDWIERVFGELQEFSDRLNLYLENQMDAVMQKKVTAILAFFLKVIGRCEHLVSRGRFRLYLRVAFLGKDEKTSKLIEDLNEQLKKEQGYVVAATYAASKNAERKVNSLSDDFRDRFAGATESLDEVKRQLEESRAREITKEDNELFEHTLELPAADRTLELYADLRRTLLAGTGAWLQKEPLFAAWSEQKVPILWVFGGPGSGKSHLSTWAINHLENLYGRDQGHPSGVSIGFFYVKENEAQLRDSNTILKTLAWQISQIDPVFKKHAVGVCSSKRNVISAEQTWNNLFLNFYRPVRTVDRSTLLIIDGLDEAPKQVRTTLLGFFKDLLTEGPGGVRPRIQVAVIGRITLKADVDFEREEKFIEVSRDKNRDDMDKYIEKRLSDIELLKKLEQLDKRRGKSQKPVAPSVRKKLKDKITAYADGVFLWAQLLLDQIQKKEVAEIEKILNNPPPSLEDMIRHVFERLAAEEEDINTIRKLLTWTAYARRPLLFGEIDLILSLPSGSPNLLLWDAFRGRFASIFQMAIPEGFVEDESETGSDSKSTDEGEIGKQEENTSDNDTSHSVDDNKEQDQAENGDENDSSEFRLLDVGADRGLEALAFDEQSASSLGNLHAYSDAQLRTVVTFSHQQFRDFLVPKHERAPMELDIDNKRSEVDITLTCFDIFGLGYSDRRDYKYLVDYPSRNLAFHLELIYKAALKTEDKHKIINGLYWLFHEEKGIRALFNAPISSESETWDELWRTWVVTDHYTKIVREWFTESDAFDQVFDDEASAWMKAAASSTKTLLQPWVMNLARIWLEKTGFDDPAYLDKSERLVWLMHGLLSIDDERVVCEELRDFTFYQLDFANLSAERLQYLADVAPVKNTPHWHTGLAWILMEATYNELAIFHFKEALKMEPDAWLPKEGLARVYGSQGRYPDAIKLMEDAMNGLPDNFQYLGGFLLPRIASWKREIGDRTGAYEAAREGFYAETSSPLAQVHFIKALDIEGYSQDIIKILEYFKESRWEETQMSYFERLLVQEYDVYDEIGRAFRATEKPRFVIEQMNQTLDILSRSKDEFLKMYLYGKIAFFIYQYDDQIEEAIKLLELALKIIANDTSASQSKNKWYRKTYENMLAQLYYDSATGARKTGMNAWPYTNKLKKLATVTTTTTEDTEDTFDFYGTGYPSMLWGRWLRNCENAEESEWRKCFRARLLEELDMLDDDDPSNDMKGLYTLAITLLQLGDDTNAAAILGALFKPLQDARESYAAAGGEEEEEEEEDDEDDDEDEEGDGEDGKDGDAKVEEGEGEGKDGDEDGYEDGEGKEAERAEEHDGKSVEEGRHEAVELRGEGDYVIVGDQSAATTHTDDSVPDANYSRDEGDQTLPSEPESAKLHTEVNGSTEDDNNAHDEEDPPLEPPQVPEHPNHDVNQVGEQAAIPPATNTTLDGRLTLELGLSWIHNCNGPCTTGPWYYTKLFFCKVCLGNKFCQDCIELVKNGTLVCRDCNPDHEWYQAWPIPDKSWEVAAEDIDGKLVIRKDWLEGLRGQWL